MTDRVYNFSAGPAALPAHVLQQAADEMLNYKGTGMSVMELSHRSPAYDEIHTNAEKNLRELMQIPANYKILFLQGGASQQFAAVPLNLLNKSGKADYINTGAWSKKAAAQAKAYGDIRFTATSEEKNFTFIPVVEKQDFREDADYVHITTNNTIFGTVFNQLPDTGDIPLVADMSSNILSEPIDVSKFGIIYAGAQKNIGPAGLTVVIVREDLIGQARPETPIMLNYKTQADADSLYNTPPTYAIYMAGLVFADLLKKGGLEKVGEINRRKAAALYDYIDASDFYSSPVNPEDRSLMNVPFVLADAELDKAFLTEAEANGLVNLKGHRSVGGMRASIYNAMPEEGVAKLVDFMKEFAAKHTA